jgi:hypothetical protein
MLLTSAPLPDLLPSWISAIATAVGVIVAVVAIGLTVHQVRLTGKQLRETARREAQDSESQTRPYVSAEAVVSLAGPPTWDIVISNSGRSTASNVTLEVIGTPFGARFPSDIVGPAQAAAFGNGFDLVASSRRRFYWHFKENARATPSQSMGAPAEGEVVIRYEWSSDPSQPGRHYEERYRYNLKEIAALTPEPWKGAEAADRSDTARDTVLALRAVAGNLGELKR